MIRLSIFQTLFQPLYKDGEKDRAHLTWLFKCTDVGKMFFSCPSSSCLTFHLIWQMVCSWRHMWGFNIAASPWPKKPLWKCAADTCKNRIMLQISVLHIVLYTHHIVLHICVNSVCAEDISAHWRINKKIKDTRMQSAMLDQWSNMVLLCLPTPPLPRTSPR